VAPIAPVIVGYLLYLLLPLWIAAGVVDWWCHRREHIERTTGATEAALHLLLLAEVGVPVLFALFFEVNALVLLIAFVAFLAHEATTIWDLTYAVRRRPIPAIEQYAHGLLHVLPVMALSCLVFLHWPQFLGLLGMGDAPDFSLTLKRDPLPTGYVVALLAAIVVLQVLPFTEEFLRGLRGARTALDPSGPVTARG